MAISEVGIVAEGQPIDLEGLNPWDHNWKLLPESLVKLSHPQHRHQLHSMNLYSIAVGERKVTFATGELSACVWGFYLAERGKLKD